MMNKWTKFAAALTAGATLSMSSVSALADDGFAQKLLGKAMQLMGVKYRYGGTSPSTGLDCSGYVQYVFKNAVGVNLPRTASEQAHVGEAITDTNIRPGDMVFFNTRGARASHVGIYVGNGMFLHSPNSRSEVRFDSMDSGYWHAHFTGARRITRANAVASSFENSPRAM